MYAKIFRNVGSILYTFCIQFVYINSDLQKVYIIRTMYTVCIQNSYQMHANNCTQKCIPYFNIFTTVRFELPR